MNEETLSLNNLYAHYFGFLKKANSLQGSVWELQDFNHEYSERELKAIENKILKDLNCYINWLEVSNFKTGNNYIDKRVDYLIVYKQRLLEITQEEYEFDIRNARLEYLALATNQ